MELNEYGRCKGCNGFGYTKGGPNGPWEKLDCKVCVLPTPAPQAVSGPRNDYPDNWLNR